MVSLEGYRSLSIKIDLKDKRHTETVILQSIPFHETPLDFAAMSGIIIAITAGIINRLNSHNEQAPRERPEKIITCPLQTPTQKYGPM